MHSLVNTIAVVLLCAPTVRAQAAVVFQVNDTGGGALVSADAVGISVVDALRQLSEVMSWRLDYATPQVESRLAAVSLDLSFVERQPRVTAMLLCAAGNTDAWFDDRSGPDGPSTVLHVAPMPDPSTEAGRQRLRRRSMVWYQQFLADKLRAAPLAAENDLRVRMEVGDLLIEVGELEEAVEHFQRVFEQDRAHPAVPRALLRMAQCYADLGDRAEAEKWAGEVARMPPSLPEMAAASVLYGRLLLEAERYDECVSVVRTAMAKLVDRREIVDLLLIAAQAHLRRQRPDMAVEQLRELDARVVVRDLSRQQWLDYHFLRGVSAEGAGSWLEAMDALEVFLITGPADNREPQACVALASAYLGRARIVEARSAAQRALGMLAELEPAWQHRARVLHARTGLALGLTDDALESLEREVRRDPGGQPELVVFLIETFIQLGRYQKAVATADLLDRVAGPFGDHSRYLEVLALWKQSERSDLLQDFVARARDVLPRIEDQQHRSQAVELLAKAHGQLGQWDQAVDVYLGIIR